MYLRTPKRYQPRALRRQHVFSMRWLWLWLFTPLVALGGYYLYENRAQFAPQVTDAINSAAGAAQSGVSTLTAPTALPTQNPSEMIARGNNAWSSGAIEEAMTAYQAAIPGAPNDVRIHYRVTLGLLMEGRTREALAAAEATVTANPFASDAWAIRSLALTRNDRPREAIASALQALALNDDNARAMAFMAEAYLNANQTARASEVASQAVEADPDSFEAYYASGLIRWLADSDFDGARADFETALDLAPNLPYIAVDLAWLEYNLLDTDSAIVLLEGVVDQNPQNLDALYALGFFYNSVYGDPDRARDYISRCLTSDDENRACLRYQGLMQTGAGEVSAAVETFRRLIGTNTPNPQHYLEAATAYLNAGDCRTAATLLQRGYQMEQAREEVDFERLGQMEQMLLECQAPLAAPTTPPGV